MCCCRNKQSTPRSSLWCVAILSFLAFVSPAWSFSFTHTALNTAVRSSSTITVVNLGLFYPYRHSVTENTNKVSVPPRSTSISQTNAKLYRNDNSELCSFYNTAETKPTASDCEFSSDTKAVAMCKALIAICGPQFQAASSFSFFQGAAALLGSLCAPRQMAVSSTKTAIFAFASALFGLIAASCVADAIVKLNTAWSDDEAPFHENRCSPFPFLAFWFCVYSLVAALCAGRRALNPPVLMQQTLLVGGAPVPMAVGGAPVPMAVGGAPVPMATEMPVMGVIVANPVEQKN